MAAISDYTQSLKQQFGLTPVMAAEIECYVPLADETVATMEAFWQPLDAAFRAENLPILRIEKERGTHQFEVITDVTSPQFLAESLRRIRAMVEAASPDATFAAKPFPHQPSSGLHLHLHLADAAGINAYHKTEDWMSEALRFSLGGLLADLESAIPVFFPNEADQARLNDPDHVPKIAGWGVNNRYCALRIPMDPDPYNKRIEHRAPCANADPKQAIAAMLRGVLRGLRERIEPPAQEYGRWKAEV